MSWEIWKLDGYKIIDRENFGDDGVAARARFADIEQARQAGTWELRRDGVYVSLYSLIPPARRD